MNFEDPFAADLSNFRSVAAGLRHTTSSPTGGGSSSSLGRGLGGTASSMASPFASLSTARGQLGTAPAGLGADSPIPGSSTSRTSLFPSAANAVPVAGRRARGTPNASSPFSATLVSVPPSLQSAASSSPLQPGQPLTQAAPPASDAPSSLAWLEDMDPSSPPAAQRQGPPPLAAVSSQPTPPVIAAAQASVPSFLNFDAVDGGGGGGGPPPAPRPFTGAFPQHLATPAATAGQSVTAAEAERKRAELRDLYATLDALDMEQQRLDERLDTLQLKQEAELLALETSVMTKRNELADKEQELATKHTELADHTAERLEALSSRYAREKDTQAAEVRSLDGARFEKQLQQLRSQCTATEEVVNGLREQAALALAMEPFSEKGVRIAMATAVASSSHTSVALTPAATSATDGGSEETKGGSRSAASPSLENGLEKAVELLRAYCDQRLGHTRQHLVDYVHTETLEAAHSVRRTRERQWADDAVAHKMLFSQYMTDMMQRYMVFYKERARLKEHNLASLQEELHRAAAELRSRAAARLQDLLKDVMAKTQLSTDCEAKSADEAKNRVQKKASAIFEADAAMATAQRKEMETRLLAEAQARRQRFQAEEQSLLEQLERLRRSNETSAQDGFRALRNSAESSGPSQVRSLNEEVAALKARISEKLYGGGAPSSVLRAASCTAHMHAEELLHVVRSALAEETPRQQSLALSRQRCGELRSELLHRIQDAVVERLQDTRCTQRAHQSRIDAQRKTWEAAHRQNLAAACSLILPLSGSTAGAADAQFVAETYAAPQDITSIALIDVVRDKLQSRDTARRRLLQSREECFARCFRLLQSVRTGQAALHTTWEDLLGAAQTQLTQQSASHEARLDVEKDLITIAVQRQTVERDRRHTERECRRIADVTQRLQVEAAQCGVDARLLCAPPELMEASVTVPAVPPSMLTSAFLHTVDPSVMNRIPGVNKFTAVHTSTNAAACTDREDAAAAAATAPSSPTAATTISFQGPLAPSASQKTAGGEKAAAVATAGAGLGRIQRDSSSNVVDASNATATQPWSSALLRAEQLLLSSSDEEKATAATEKLQMPTPAKQSGHFGDTGVIRVSIGGSNNNNENSTNVHHVSDRVVDKNSGSRRDGSTTSPSSGSVAEQRRRSFSSLRSAENAPQPGSSTWLDSDTGTLPQQRLRIPAFFPWQLQQLQGSASNLLETWSTLEEFRSGVDRPTSAVRVQGDISGEGTTFSFDDSTNFVDLLSCTDSPSSSSPRR